MVLISWVYGLVDFRLDGYYYWRQFNNQTMMSKTRSYFLVMEGLSGNLAHFFDAFRVGWRLCDSLLLWICRQPEQSPSPDGFSD
ncbi:hypothetical protein MA16_Dca006084 [Dendrobium catenatum]|uniref:Uncharacterized protein n=1 Tax=Dendrobium catenatum TaxID=906689 RepID=A0A2I0X4F1_9ASPA|nr:hypothetical protein MA16_Dca006084 [Dendrobium catenatum]